MLHQNPFDSESFNALTHIDRINDLGPEGGALICESV